jgi:hypothetical protein
MDSGAGGTEANPDGEVLYFSHIFHCFNNILRLCNRVSVSTKTMAGGAGGTEAHPNGVGQKGHCNTTITPP